MSSSPDIQSAVILAAGRGTRLGALTEDLPKPLLSVAGRPLIVHILDGLITAGIRDVVIVTGYRANMIEAELGNGAGSGIHIRYLRQESLDGTAAALALVREHLADRRFLFAWGDILVPPQNYRAVVRASRLADGAIAVNPMEDLSAGAAVLTDPPLPWPPDGPLPSAIVSAIIEKPAGAAGMHWNNAGIGVLGPEIWPAIARLAPSPRGELELPAAIDLLVHEGARLRAVPVDGPWWDIGTPDALAHARQTFSPS